MLEETGQYPYNDTAKAHRGRSFMSEVIALLAGGILGWVLHHWLRQKKEPAPTVADRHRLYQIAESLKEFFNNSAHPTDLLAHETFQEGIDTLNAGDYDTRNLLDYAAGDNPAIACIALEALARRTDDADLLEPVAEKISSLFNWQRFFALRVLEKRVKAPAVARLLAGLDDSWESSFSEQFLMDFIRARIDQGETPAFETLSDPDEDDEKWMEKFLKEVDRELDTCLIEGFQAWQQGRLDVAYLTTLGRIRDEDDGTVTDVIEEDSVLGRVKEIKRALRKEPPRSVLLVGEAGVGKTTTLEVLSRRLLDDGWTLFEAGGVELMAGQMYIGQLEERIQKLVRTLQGKAKVLWIIPSFQNLLFAGRHRYSQTSVLDVILPYLQTGGIRIVAEVRPGALERLVQAKPGLKTALETLVLPRLSDHETLRLARQWVDHHTPEGGPALMEPHLLNEAFQLSQQFLGDRANPGCLLGFLSLTREFRIAATGGDGAAATAPLTLDDLLATLTRLTGLPASILDDRQDLNLDALRDFFHTRVMGQPEVVACLVERVAMIKAGLTDPTRPQGVFLFTGPTGTGKTEIAKTLAEFLFGSPDRMIRLDMSEFQTSDTLPRILGEDSDSGTGDRTALVHQIRKQPFSVILLDEFEKAHARVWDLFLQVFDDGRLTDRQGNHADFRHAMVILTVNVGAEAAFTEAIGFGETLPSARTEEYETALTRVFRREFLNRIDRVVVFRPLSKAVMREVLHKELEDVLRRRGLRNRQWAVEWDASALDFLLARGFSSRYGARPLKRAVERYLLSPLAMTIVNHQVPEGDQFLYVRSDGSAIQVEFIDPDAPETEGEAMKEAGPAAEGEHRLQSIVLDPTGTPGEVAFLGETYDSLRDTAEDEAWKAEKHKALDALSSPDFWSSEIRFSVLGRAEYMDRIEAGLKTSGSLLNRLKGSEGGNRKHHSPDLVQRLAQHLYLVQAAMEGFIDGRPQDAFLQVEAARDSLADARDTDAFAARIGTMYRHWARNRGMALETLEEKGDGAGAPYLLTLAVSGYAAFNLLEPEHGLHVLEVPGDNRSTLRHKVRVGVAAQPEAPPARTEGGHLAQARKALAATDPGRLTIVRRYRDAPSPLVRDSLRGWRTGRFDQVMAGNFDLF